MICPVCAGHPGTLPCVNAEAIRLGLKTALSLKCDITRKFRFDRKNYFYPDLPKGYQITQWDFPIGRDGSFILSNKMISITRAHLEEDAGKLTHIGNKTSIDLNRAGTPLIEIVTGPDFESIDEVTEYLNKLKTLLTYLGVSECAMEKGSLRCDANVSVKLKDSKELGTRVEIKNLNSFKEIAKAIEYERKRQIAILEGELEDKIIQSTVLWDADKEETRIMRLKGDSDDYRYFPEPDIPVISLSEELIEKTAKEIPEYPWTRKERIANSFDVSEYQADLLTRTKELADYFEATVEKCENASATASFMLGEIAKYANEHNINADKTGMSPDNLAELIVTIDSGKINLPYGKRIIGLMLENNISCPEAIKNDDCDFSKDLNSIIEEVLKNNQKAVDNYLDGKTNALNFLKGQTMKITKNSIDPQEIESAIAEKLNTMATAKEI